MKKKIEESKIQASRTRFEKSGKATVIKILYTTLGMIDIISHIIQRIIYKIY